MGNSIFKKIVFFIAVFLLLVVIAFTIFMVSNKYSFNDLDIMLSREKITDIGVYKTININNELLEIEVCDDGIYVFNSNGYVFYDKNGDLINEGITEFFEPNITCNDNEVLLYGSENTYYEIFEDGRSSSKIEANTIIAMELTTSNYISIIKDNNDGYTGEVIVINRKNDSNAIVKYANLYPVSVTTLRDSNLYVVVTINTLDINNTYIDIYNMFEDEAIAGITVEGSYPYVFCVGNELFLLANELGYKIYNINGEQLEKLDGSIIDIQSRYNRIYIAYSRNGKNYLRAIDESGSTVFEKQSNYQIMGIDSYKNNLAIFGDTNISIFDKDGKILSDLDMFTTINKVLLIDSNRILINGNNDIVLYKYK